MLIQKDFLNKIKAFGLNSYEGKIWTALLSRGVSTAGELSDISNVPRSRSYDILESLQKKGFIISKQGKPIKYIAIDPLRVIERVKKRTNEKINEQLELIENLKTGKVIDELNLLHNQGLTLVKPTDLRGVIKGRRNIYNHLSAMIKESKKTISIATTSEGIIRKQDVLLNYLAKAKQRGVKIRFAVPLNPTKELTELAKISEIYNTNIKARFCIVDKKEALIMLMDDEKVHPIYDTAIWVNSEFFSNFLEGCFCRIFNHSSY